MRKTPSVNTSGKSRRPNPAAGPEAGSPVDGPRHDGLVIYNEVSEGNRTRPGHERGVLFCYDTRPRI